MSRAASLESKDLTLASFHVPIPLFCFHCEAKLTRKTKVEVNGKYVIAYCGKCGCMTPFEIEETK